VESRKTLVKRERLVSIIPLLRFIDIEASAGGPEGWPIEIGWSVVAPGIEPVSWSSLIRPDDSWEDCWSHHSQKIHGITRQELEVAPSAALVARKIIAALAAPGVIVISDSPKNDQPWLDRLLSAAGQPPGTIRIISPGAAFNDFVPPEKIKAMKDYLRDNKGPHRAGEDAVRLAHAILAGPLDFLYAPALESQEISNGPS